MATVVFDLDGTLADTSADLIAAANAVFRARGAGYRTAVCTNKPEALAETLLVRLGLREAFGALVGADTLPVRKPDPRPFALSVTRAGGDPARSVLIGDTETDRETARAAGVPCVLVTFGPDGGAVAALDPEALLDHYDALDTVVAPLLRRP